MEVVSPCDSAALRENDRRLTFHDLPGEIRNRIYHLALISFEPLRLRSSVAESGIRYLRYASSKEMNEVNFMQSVRASHYSFSVQARLIILDWKNGIDDLDRLPGYLHKVSKQRVQDHFAFGLLRSCRMIRREALRIFYGQNTWTDIGYEVLWRLED